MNSKLAPWQREAIVRLSVLGEKSEALAAEFGISICYVSKLRNKAGFRRRPGRPEKTLPLVGKLSNLSHSVIDRLSPVIG